MCFKWNYYEMLLFYSGLGLFLWNQCGGFSFPLHDDWLNVWFNLNPLKYFHAHSNARLEIPSLKHFFVCLSISWSYQEDLNIKFVVVWSLVTEFEKVNEPMDQRRCSRREKKSWNQIFWSQAWKANKEISFYVFLPLSVIIFPAIICTAHTLCQRQIL